MTKRKIYITLAIFLVTLTLLRIGWILFYNEPNHPRAVQGQLDLRDWDLTSKRPIPLDGEWEFYPHKFIQSKQIDHNKAITGASYIQVPGNWKPHLFKDQTSAEGYGSYRLRILVNPVKYQTYSFHVSKILSSSELFVDGVSLRTNGQPASSKELYTPKAVPYTVTFSPDKSVIELVIHVSNFDHMSRGGITHSIRFGTGTTMSNEQLLLNSLQLMMAVIFFIHAIYVGILYFIGFRQKSLIYLHLALLFAVLMTLADDSQLLFYWLPLSFEWNTKIIIISYLGAALFLLEYLKLTLREYTIVHSFRLLTLLSLIYILFIILAPARYILQSTPLFAAIFLLSFLMMPILVMSIALRNSRDALLLVLVASALTNNVLWGFIKNLGFSDLMYYPFDLIIALITFASFWFSRFIQTAKQTQQLAVKLQMTDKQKDKFLANTSHELRTPLHGMINIAQHVLNEEEGNLKQQNAQNLQLLLTIGQRMSHTLHDLLDLSQLQDGRIHLNLGSIRIQSVASGVMDMLKFMTEGKAISLSMNIPDSFPPVSADEKRLVQVLYNLIQNAIKFTDEGTISIHAELRDQQAIIHITDTGVGMDEELIDRAFKAYEQGDPENSASIGGIGLGLGICEQIISLHGGTITVASIPGQGSTFTFTLPLSNSEHIDSTEAMEAPLVNVEVNNNESNVPQPLKTVVASNRPKILIVDDDTVNLKVLENILSIDRYEMVKVTNGKDALLLLDSASWDLIITDVMMPRMSGYELTRTIRERYSISELPILLLTARSQPEDINSGFIAGANDYVTKPVNAYELIPRVTALTDLKRSVGKRLRLEAAYMQAQIKPHFLFNTLNSITALSDIDLPKMNDLIEAFSSYLRISFDFWNSQQLVPIKHEFELVHSYLYIQKQRFEDRLNYVWDVQPDIDVLIPPLTIQPLVENAVRHGLLSLSKGGTVLIRVRQHEHHTEISVEDNGVGMNEDKLIPLLDLHEVENRGIGLLNTDRRLKQLYGEGLHIWSQPNQGTKISFKIPSDCK